MFSIAAGSSGPASGGPASACPDLQEWSEGCVLCRWVSFLAPNPGLSRAPTGLPAFREYLGCSSTGLRLPR